MFLIYEVSSSFKSYIYLFFGNEMRRYFTSLDLFPYVYFYFLDSEKLRRRCFVVSPIVFPYMNLFVFFFFIQKNIRRKKKCQDVYLSFFFFSLLFFVCEYFSLFLRIGCKGYLCLCIVFYFIILFRKNCGDVVLLSLLSFFLYVNIFYFFFIFFFFYY